MTVFDLIVLSFVVASVVAGAMRGLVRAAVTLVALLVGVVLAAHAYEWAGEWLLAAGAVETKAAADGAGFLLVVALALALGFAAGEVAKGGLKRARLGWLDRSLGALFGLLRGAAVCSLIYLALTAFPVRLASVTEARTAPALAEGARLLAFVTSAEVQSLFREEYRRLTA
jgi:membrane protein required for colicin V production